MNFKSKIFQAMKTQRTNYKSFLKAVLFISAFFMMGRSNVFAQDGGWWDFGNDSIFVDWTFGDTTFTGWDEGDDSSFAWWDMGDTTFTGWDEGNDSDFVWWDLGDTTFTGWDEGDDSSFTWWDMGDTSFTGWDEGNDSDFVWWDLGDTTFTGWDEGDDSSFTWGDIGDTTFTGWDEGDDSSFTWGDIGDTTFTGWDNGDSLITQGGSQENSQMEAITTGMEEQSEGGLISLGNYPNPFTDVTTISYTLVADESMIELSITDMLGKKIALLDNQSKSAGSYQTVWNANGAKPGVYLLQMNVNGKMITKKLVLNNSSY